LVLQTMTGVGFDARIAQVKVAAPSHGRAAMFTSG
jgi:hypothetical protein